MDVPADIGRYLGCDHVQELQVKLSVRDHLFAHLFDKSLPDPAAKEAAAAERTQDFWEVDASLEVKLPTIWTDEKQSRAEAERRERLEERRVEEKESEERRCRCAKR